MFALRPHRLWIWLVIAAVLVGRFDGAHLHLCFDGQEAPAAVHMADGANHDEAHHLDGEHLDQDVSLADTLLKKTSVDNDMALAVLAALLFVLPPVAAVSTSPAPLIHPQLRRLLFFDPPPRGPPL